MALGASSFENNYYVLQKGFRNMSEWFYNFLPSILSFACSIKTKILSLFWFWKCVSHGQFSRGLTVNIICSTKNEFILASLIQWPWRAGGQLVEKWMKGTDALQREVKSDLEFFNLIYKWHNFINQKVVCADDTQCTMCTWC